MNDWCLIQHYNETRSEPAFAKIIERHMNLVYWTCRRELRNDQLAEDATQIVFLLLARKAPGLNRNVAISGWLFKAAIWVSRDLIKHETRRRQGEEETTKMIIETQEQSKADWSEVDPWLNEGLNSLSQADREVILMRYFDDHSMDEIASALGTTEVTTRKRLSRAIDRLRDILVRRKVSITSSALATLLLEHQARSVPETCHAATLNAVHGLLANHAAGALTTHAQAALWKKGLLFIMETTTKKIIAATVVVLILGGISVPIVRGIKATNQERKAAATIGTGGFTNQLPSSNASSTSNLPSASDRAEILNDYQEIDDAYNRRDINAWASFMAPDMKYTIPNYGSMTATAYLAIIRPFVAAHTQTKDYEYLTSMTQNGNEVIATINSRNMTLSTDHDTAPPGTIQIRQASAEDHWQKRDGHWVLTQAILLSQSNKVQQLN